MKTAGAAAAVAGLAVRTSRQDFFSGQVLTPSSG